MDVLSQMDVAKPKKKPRWRRPLPLLAFASLAAVSVFILGTTLLSQPLGEHKVERSRLLIGAVQRGDLQVAVDGYGVLRSNQQALITALSNAIVEEVVLRPGAEVEEQSVILRLSNPDLLQEVDAAAIAVAQATADLRRLVLRDKRELLAEQSTLARLRSQYQTLRMRNEAQKELAAQGVIPKLDFQAAVLKQQLLLERAELQGQRIEQLKKAAQESLIIQQEQINHAKARHQSIQQRADRLTVRAGLKGVLQRLPVELGQSLTAGQELAVVGSDKDLLALVRISQSRADKVRIGQSAEINTRREKAPGVVTRIAPEVHEGTIEVEIKFSGAVPASARPELNVDARVFTATLHDVLYVERPVNAQVNSPSALFQLQPDGKLAKLRDVRFGEESGRYIQLLSGANANDRFILSDTSAFRDARQIALIY